MKVKVYSYKNCDTCRKALKFLAKKKIPFEEVDITTTAPTKAELKNMLKRYDGELRKLFNTSGQVYKEMKLSEKLTSLSQAAAIDLLSDNGRLVKRPFLLVDGKASHVGFKDEEWSEVF